MTRITIDIPEIVTDRLVLRAPERRDFDHMVVFFQSERSHNVGGPRDESECWRTLQGIFGHWHFNGFGFWHIHHKANDRVIGAAGFLNMPGWHETELGWHVYDGYEGKGYAYEAAKAARAHGSAKMGLDGVISYIAPSNTRSRNLAIRLGATFERDDTLRGTDVHIYRHPEIGSAL